MKHTAHDNSPCSKCNGTGSVRIDLPAEPSKCRDLGGGYYIVDAGGSMAHLCECRSALPRRYGKARWWTTERPHSEYWESAGGLSSIQISVQREVPVSDDNYPLHRTADNRYFQVTAGIEADFGPDMTADAIRDAAAFLTRMAELVEKLDEPHPDEVKP